MLLPADMTHTICVPPESDHSTQVVETNTTFAQYTCRVGYRFESGDTQRTCDANGTWSGVQPVCAVDSILPKAYLVILIVGATIAVFLACIPYDFYRFRKRKKKVRDHQERLSLVTRIAPGHAKVVLEAMSASQNQMGYSQSRRFGLKSLFSVFRFVGGKMRSASHGHIDASNPVCAEEHNTECEVNQIQQSTEDVARDLNGATASTYIFNTHQLQSCPSPDVIDLCPLAKHTEFDSISGDLVSEMSSIPEELETGPRSGSPLLLDNTDVHESLLPAKKGFQMFKKANEIFHRDTDSRRQTSNTTKKSSNSGEPLGSEPATVDVTPISKLALSKMEDQLVSPQDDTSVSKVTSSGASASSSEAPLVKKGCPKVEQAKTFHYPIGKNSVAYHSMPTISDIP